MKTFQQNINDIRDDVRKERRQELERDIIKNTNKELEDKLISNGCERFYIFYSYTDFDGDPSSSGLDNFPHTTDCIGMVTLAAHWFEKLFYQSRDHILHGVLSPYFNDCKYILLTRLKLDGGYYIITNTLEHEFFGVLWSYKTNVAARIGSPMAAFMRG